MVAPNACVVWLLLLLLLLLLETNMPRAYSKHRFEQPATPLSHLPLFCDILPVLQTAFPNDDIRSLRFLFPVRLAGALAR
jgi:hypothetical protein